MLNWSCPVAKGSCFLCQETSPVPLFIPTDNEDIPPCCCCFHRSVDRASPCRCRPVRQHILANWTVLPHHVPTAHPALLRFTLHRQLCSVGTALPCAWICKSFIHIPVLALLGKRALLRFMCAPGTRRR